MPPSRRIVASSPRRSAVAIAAVLIERQRRERDREADDHPDAPGAARAERAHGVEVLRAGEHRPSPGRARRASAPATNTAVSAGCGGVATGELAVDDDVAEAGGAVVDRGDAQRHRGRVLEPGGQDVADLHVALGGDRATDRDGGAADVADVAAADAEVERARGVGTVDAGGRPRRVPARQALAEQEHLRRDHARRGVARRVAARAAPPCPAGSGAPSRPATTCSARTRSPVTRSVSCFVLVASTPCVPASIAISRIGVASAALRQRFAASPVLASSPGAPSARSGAASRATGSPSSQRPSSADAGREQDARDDRERVGLLALEQERDGGAAAERGDARERAHDTGPAVLDRRPRAAPRRAGPCRRAARPRRPRAGRCRRPCRARPRAGSTSGRARSPRARRRGPRAGRRARWRADGRPAARARSRRARRTTPRWRSGGGPGAGWRRAPAGQRSRGAAGRSRARTCRRPRTAPRSRRCRPSCRRSRSATRGRSPAGRPRRRRPRGRGRAPRGRSAPADRARRRERVMTPTALMRPGAPESVSAAGPVKKTAAWPRSWLAAPRATPETR